MSELLSIIIPCYNESGRLPQTLADIQKYLEQSGRKAEVIVVDDGSQDDMKDKVKIMQETFPELTLITYDVNRGKGYATKTGMMASSGDIVLFMDADNSTNIREFDKIEPLLAEYDVVIGSRYLPDSDIVIEKKLHRTLISRFSNLLIRLLLDISFRDTQCGFKVFKHEHIKPIFSRQLIDRFGFDMELIVIARELGLKIKEVPVRWVDDPNTTVRPIRDTYRTFRELLRIRDNLKQGMYKL